MSPSLFKEQAGNRFKLVYCIRNEKTPISPMSPVELFICGSFTLANRRKPNPSITTSGFKGTLFI